MTGFQPSVLAEGQDSPPEATVQETEDGLREALCEA